MANTQAPITLLLFDLDGTLLDPRRRIHPRNAAVFERARAHGVRTGFATGRPPRSVRPYVEELAPTGPLICFNGGVVWDLTSERALLHRGLDVVDAKDALELARAAGVHANLYVGDDIYIEADSETARASALKDGVQQEVAGPLASFLHDSEHSTPTPTPPTKILFIAEPGALRALHDAIRAADVRSVLVFSEPTYLEMLPPDTNKGAALDTVVAACGITLANVCAFGDNLNDLELIERAGVGVAMANAHERLRERADVIIGDNAGDAIARFLEDTFVWETDGLRRRSR